MRYERFYRWVYDVDAAGPYRGDNHWQVPSPVRWQTRHTELIGQKTSWGPMQIMGATARELGFRGWFPELCGPLGIEYGARYLRKQFDRYEGESWEDAIEAYNAGRRNTDDGERYREKVMRKWRRLDTT